MHGRAGPIDDRGGTEIRVFNMTIVLVGIGMPLRGDDGAGPAAVQTWMHAHPETARNPRIHVIQTGSPGVEILSHWESAEAVLLVDAVQTGMPAGSIRIFDPIPDSLPTSPAEKSAHGFGISQTIALAKQLQHPLPDRLILIGVEAGQFTIGAGLSEEVRSHLSEAADVIESIIQNLMEEKPSQT
jgi:hydrogenase maturation protease